MPKIRVLVVDDAVVVRQLISKVLSQDSELEVVGVAANGRIALAKIPQVNPDLVVLDIEMPEMDGLETLKAIRKTYPVLPVIMFSAVTERGAAATLDALALGAMDYVTKPTQTSREAAMDYIQAQLSPKIKALCRTPIDPPFLSMSPLTAQASTLSKRAIATAPIATDRTLGSVSRDRRRIDLIAIGVSTGGPNALTQLLTAFPADLPVPIVIVQHMPPLFTQRLAERLTSQCQIPVLEGDNGDILKPGKAWLAPGNFHMVVERNHTDVQIRTHQAPPENSCRPAVDVLFRSAVQVYGEGVLGIVLTGMGQDGLHGCQCIHEAGGQVLVQDEATSVVWGMPGIVANAGLADRILPLNQLAHEIMRRLEKGRSWLVGGGT